MTRCRSVYRSTSYRHSCSSEVRHHSYRTGSRVAAMYSRRLHSACHSRHRAPKDFEESYSSRREYHTATYTCASHRGVRFRNAVLVCSRSYLHQSPRLCAGGQRCIEGIMATTDLGQIAAAAQSYHDSDNSFNYYNGVRSVPCYRLFTLLVLLRSFFDVFHFLFSFCSEMRISAALCVFWCDIMYATYAPFPRPYCGGSSRHPY